LNNFELKLVLQHIFMQHHVATNVAITCTESAADFAHKMEQRDMRKSRVAFGVR
ncbi:MAG: hypothetical protein ACI93R_002349, partial [Flavobacteriales bacterium]